MFLPPLITLSRILTLSAILLCVTSLTQTTAAETKDTNTETGIAAYYSNAFQGRRTANGERYDKNAYTAAHKHYPFGTRVRVTNLANDKSAVVRINDRGPSSKARIIDVSRRVAKELGFLKAGLTKVRLEVLKPKRTKSE